MTGSHRRRNRREPDAFFAENLAEILPETDRKNGRSISAGAERAKQGAKDRLAGQQIKAVARRLKARQYRGQRRMEERRQSGFKRPVLEQKSGAAPGQEESRPVWSGFF
jgi:hypothetical protein